MHHLTDRWATRVAVVGAFLAPSALPALLSILLPIAGCGTSAAKVEPAPTRVACRDLATIEPGPKLALAYDAAGSVLTIELHNAGAAPIRVDKELVLMVSVAFLDAKGLPIWLQRGDTVRRPRSFRGRFITVPPGGKVTRRIDLRGEFPAFVWGWLSADRPPADMPNAYIAMHRLPPGARPAAVEVNYGLAGLMYADCVRFYTHKAPRERHLYQRSLRERIALPARP